MDVCCAAAFANYNSATGSSIYIFPLKASNSEFLIYVHLHVCTQLHIYYKYINMLRQEHLYWYTVELKRHIGCCVIPTNTDVVPHSEWKCRE